jgi:hypothetical protein
LAPTVLAEVLSVSSATGWFLYVFVDQGWSAASRIAAASFVVRWWPM